MDFLEWLNKYDSSKYKQATGVNLGEDFPNFYMVYVEDCFDPPVAIVRGESAEDALDTFIDELTWAHMSDEDVEEAIQDHAEKGKSASMDDPPDWVTYSSGGQAYNSESLMIRDIKLYSVEVD
jgi:hypothetical protein